MRPLGALLLLAMFAAESLAQAQTSQPLVAFVAQDPVELQPAAQLPAQVEPLCLVDFEGLAFHHNPTLAAAAARVNAARGGQIQAGLYPNPVIGYHGVEMGLRDTSGQQGGFVSQRFVLGSKLQLDQAIAGKAMTEAQFRFHAQELRVLSDVRVRFYELLVAQRRSELTRELARIGDALVEATEQLIEGRLGTENDLLQAEIRADESHMLFDNALNQNVEAWRRLLAVVGMPAMQVMPVAGDLGADFPMLDWEQCCAMVLTNHPQLSAARTRVESARVVIERAKREPIPNVELMVSHRHHNVTGDNVTNVQFGIPIPVFDRNQGNVRTAEAEWVAACRELQRVELELRDGLAVAYRRYANARQQVDRYAHKIIPRAERSLELVSEGYDKGQVDYLTQLNSQTTYLRVNLAYLDSLQALWVAASTIEGQLLADSLRPRVQPNR